MSWSEGRWYWPDGRPCNEIDSKKPTVREARKYDLVPSVTTHLSAVSKPGLIAWASKLAPDEAERVRDQGAAFGTAAHEGVAALLRHEKAEYPSQAVLDAVMGCAAWLDASGLKVLEVEKSFALVSEGYAGTADLVAIDTRTEQIAVVDWKTGSFVDKPMWGAQVAAYAHGLGFEDARLIVVQVRPEGCMALEFTEQYEAALAGFRAAKALWYSSLGPGATLASVGTL